MRDRRERRWWGEERMRKRKVDKNRREKGQGVGGKNREGEEGGNG